MSERGKERVRRSSESAAESRVGDSGTRSWREATSPVVITAHCRARGERIASHRSAEWRCVAAQKAEPVEELSVWQEHGSLMDC